MRRLLIIPLPAYLCSWWLAALAILFLKWRLLELEGYRIAARQFGRIQVDGLTISEKASFFGCDILDLLLIAPLIVTLVLYFIPSACRAILVFGAAAGAFAPAGITHNSDRVPYSCFKFQTGCR